MILKIYWHQQIDTRPMTKLLSFMNESSLSLVGIIHSYFLEIILVVNQLGDNFIMGSIAIFISKKSCYFYDIILILCTKINLDPNKRMLKDKSYLPLVT